MRMDTASSKFVLPVRPHDVTMHVATIYDVENEHDYIMDKALQAYNQHRKSEEKDRGDRDVISSSQRNDSGHHHHHHHHHLKNNHKQQRRRFHSTSSGSHDGTLSSSSSSSASSMSKIVPSSASPPSAWEEKKLGAGRKGFKLSLCTLKDALGKEPAPVPYPHSTPSPGYLPQQRPWSASPATRLDAIREVSLANRTQDRKTPATSRPVHQHRQQGVRHRHKPPTPHPGKMDPPVSRSAAYKLRNRTTHSWSPTDAAADDYDDLTGSRYSPDSGGPLDPMTMSCPNARSLEEHVRHARAAHPVPRDPNPSPVVVKGRAIVSPSSPTPPFPGTPGSRERPSSAYSYDGGLFLNAPGGGSGSVRDYFVIHPDWVSEAMTVQKISLTERQGRPTSRCAGGPASSVRRLSYWAARGEDGEEEEEEEEGVAGAGGRRSARRCKSAPPTKYRNPLSWS